MTMFSIKNDGIKTVDIIPSQCVEKESISFSGIGLRITLFTTPYEKGTLKKEDLLLYDLPSPFDRFILKEPAFVKFEGGSVKTISQVERIFSIIKPSLKIETPRENVFLKETEEKKTNIEESSSESEEEDNDASTVKTEEEEYEFQDFEEDDEDEEEEVFQLDDDDTVVSETPIDDGSAVA